MASHLEIVAAACPGLSRASRAVYAALLAQDPADPYTTARLAAATGLNRRTVYGAATELESHGCIRLTRGIGHDNRYAALAVTVHSGRA